MIDLGRITNTGVQMLYQGCEQRINENDGRFSDAEWVELRHC